MFYIFFRASLSAIGYLMHSIYCHDFLETNLSNRQGRSQYCHNYYNFKNISDKKIEIQMLNVLGDVYAE